MYIFQEKRIRAEDLVPAETKSSFETDGKLRGMERDVSKLWIVEDKILSFLNIENQTEAFKGMVARLIGYDGAMYRGMVDTNLYYSIFNFILNMSFKPWRSAKELKELFDIPKGMEDFFQNYHIHVIDVIDTTKEQMERFESDFKLIADYYVQTKNGKKYIIPEWEMEYPKNVLLTLYAHTGDPKFIDYFNTIKEKEMEKCTMKNIIQMTIDEEVEKEVEKRDKEMKEEYKVKMDELDQQAEEMQKQAEEMQKQANEQADVQVKQANERADEQVKQANERADEKIKENEENHLNSVLAMVLSLMRTCHWTVLEALNNAGIKGKEREFVLKQTSIL